MASALLSKTESMPYIKIYIHIVWATKNRQKFLTKEIRPQLFEHIKKNAKDKNIFLDTIGGWQDHIHCLISLDTSQSIANIINLIKGESSFWLNKNKLTNTKFSWQSEYFAVSISPKDIEKVRNYIKNQENHHKKKTFQQEYEDFLQKSGFTKVKD